MLRSFGILAPKIFELFCFPVVSPVEGYYRNRFVGHYGLWVWCRRRQRVCSSY